MTDKFKYLSPREFQKLSQADRKRYLTELYEHLHGLPGNAPAAAEQDLLDYCPFCGAFLCRVHAISGQRSPDSAAVVSDGHGTHSVCLNPACKRKVRLIEDDGTWVVAPDQQDTD